jgi:hypothetical protein
MTTATTDYMLLDSKDGIIYTAEPLYPSATSNSKEYPGNRRQAMLNTYPPEGSVLVKTGGNALMAVDRSVVEQSNIISAVVPLGKGPGDIILVKCPYSDRLINVTIPDGVAAGQVLLVQSPPLESAGIHKKQSTTLDDNGNPILSEEYDDLKLAAEDELEKRHFGSDEESPVIRYNPDTDESDHHDFEMISKPI